MATIDQENKTIQIKIVYYGPGRSGKTTNLEYLFNKYKKHIKTKIAVINTLDDNTLFFDFFPLDIGKINGYQVRVQFYTVPGQVKYEATRRLVLKGVDGIVFVADSMVVRRKKNLISLKSLKENLATYNKVISQIPLVFQYNKRDLKDQGIPILSIETLERDLNGQLKAPSYEASALNGMNVIPTMKKAVSLTIVSLQKRLKQGEKVNIE